MCEVSFLLLTFRPFLILSFSPTLHSFPSTFSFRFGFLLFIVSSLPFPSSLRCLIYHNCSSSPSHLVLFSLHSDVSILHNRAPFLSPLTSSFVYLSRTPPSLSSPLSVFHCTLFCRTIFALSPSPSFTISFLFLASYLLYPYLYFFSLYLPPFTAVPSFLCFLPPLPVTYASHFLVPARPSLKELGKLVLQTQIQIQWSDTPLIFPLYSYSEKTRKSLKPSEISHWSKKVSGLNYPIIYE